MAPTRDLPEQLLPEQLLGGRYELREVVGTGSSAVVHRARDRHRGEWVAVKVFHPGVELADPRRHRNEIDALTGLAHPGLVALHDSGGGATGPTYMVLDLVDGPTLGERILLGGPLRAVEVRRLGARVAAALAHVHAAGIVHRDVKPANVLLDRDGAPRLTDFGVAWSSDAASVTRVGTVVGTAAFLAPEQVRGEPVGPPADVYALGLVLLEAVTGRREYPGAAVEAAAARLHRSPAVPRDLPVDLARTIAAMTATAPARRPSAAEVAGSLAVAPGTATLPAWRRPARRSWLVGTGLAVVGVAALLAGGVGPGNPVPVRPAAPATPAVAGPEIAGVPETGPEVAAPETVPAIVAGVVKRPGG